MAVEDLTLTYEEIGKPRTAFKSGTPWRAVWKLIGFSIRNAFICD